METPRPSGHTNGRRDMYTRPSGDIPMAVRACATIMEASEVEVNSEVERAAGEGERLSDFDGGF